MNNYALYYPTIEFSDYEWLWNAALLWDRIYRIVPSGYQPKDCENVRVLAEQGEIGIAIQPDKYVAKVAEEFIEKLQSEQWTAAALDYDVPEEYGRLHKDKVGMKLREMIIAKGGGTKHEDWLYVPSDFEALYMTYLANHIARTNRLQMLSDSVPAWTGSTYFRYDGDVQDYPQDEYIQQLAILVLRDFLPENVMAIPPEAITRFRKKYGDERRNFVQTIQRSAETLAACEDPAVVNDRIEDLKREIESSLVEYRKTVETLKITGWTGIKSLSFPIVTKVAAEISGTDLDPGTLLVVSSLGIGLGLVSGLADWRQKRKKLKRESDYSYLLHLSREWKGRSLYDKDYNYFLCRKMEEFIND